MARRGFGSLIFIERGKAWDIAFTVGGRRTRRRVASERDGLRLLAEIESRVLRRESLASILEAIFGEASGARLSLREAAVLFLEFREPRVKRRTFKIDVIRLRGILRHGWTARPLSQIGPQEIEGFVRKRVSGSKAVSSASVNRDLAILSALFRWAVRLGYVERNPVKQVDMMSEKGRARTEWLSREDIAVLLTAADPRFRPALQCLILTGLRRGELLSLRWKSVDLDLGELVVEPEFTKTGKERHIKLTQSLLDVLRSMRGPSTRADDHVFLRPGSRQPHSEGSLRYWMKHTLKTCPRDSGLRSRKITLHVLRHTFASHLAQAGVPYQDIGYLLGHLNSYVTQRYAHMTPETGREAIARLEQRLPELPGEVRELGTSLARGRRRMSA